MKQYETIEYTVEANPIDGEESIGVIAIDRPERSNSMTGLFMIELDTICSRLEHDRNIDVVVITGNGDSFSAGGDLFVEGELLGYTGDDDDGEWLPGKYQRVLEIWLNDYYHVKGQEAFLKLERLPQPTIAAVNGWAVGAGVELVAACDLAIGSEEARFSEIAASIGFITEWGGAWNLPHVVGIRKALEMLYTGMEVDAHTAEDIGLLNRVAPPEELYDEAIKFAGEIAAKPQPSIQLTKSLVRTYLNEGLRTAAQGVETENVINLTRMEHAEEAMKNFVRGKGPLRDE